MPASLLRVLNNPLMLIFTLLSVGNFVYGLRLGRDGWQQRATMLAEPLRPGEKRWAESAAILLAVPLGVAIHEFCHALATWLFGGQIVEFGYFFYWGYVVSVGNFSPAQDWFISLAGTLGTLAYGVGLWLLLRHHRSSLGRYFGVRALRFHLYYALIYYPLFTLFTFVGDWRVIYDFALTPTLSGLTLGVHLLLLTGFFVYDRRGWFEMPGFTTPAGAQTFQLVQQQLALNPDDLLKQEQYIDVLRQAGAPNQAREQLRHLLRHHPDLPEGYLLQASLLAHGKRQPPVKAVRAAEKALALGLSRPGQVAYANSLLAQYNLDTGRVDEALRQLNEALAQTAQSAMPNQAYLYYLRATAHRRKQQYAAARQDIEQALLLAEGPGREEAVAFYRREQETIASHARHTP